MGALIGISELLKLAPPSLEMQGFPKRRQTNGSFGCCAWCMATFP
jgi:hypothetical protein